MANIISNRMLASLGEGATDLVNDTIKVALMTSTYSEDKDINTFVNTNEISGDGYLAGGKVLTNSSIVQDDTSDLVKWDADDVEWLDSTLVARYVVVYDVTVSNTILTVIDLVTDKMSSGGTFAVRWSIDGIATFIQG